MKTLLSRDKAPGWRLSLLLAGLALLAALACCRMVFETNDDNNIIAIASGAFTGSPYGGNGYTSYLYGALLAGLYTLWQGMPWHALLMLGVIFFSLAAILRSFLALCQARELSAGFGLGLFLALFAGVFFPYGVQLQYTATAAFAGGAGAVLVLCLSQGLICRDKVLTGAIAAGLLLFSFGLRADSFWACLPLLGGFLLLDSLSARSLRPLAPLAAVLCGALLLAGADQALYRAKEPNWDEFRSFYALRCQLLDYDNTDLMEQIATVELGWPESTVKMLRNWYMLDEHMNTQDLQVLLTAVAKAKPSLSPSALIKSTASILRRYPMFGLNFAAFGLWAIVSAWRYFRQRQWTALLGILGTAAYLAAFITYFYGVLGRLPERAAFAAALPCYAFLALACLPAWGRPPQEDAAAAKGTRRLRCLGLSLLLLAGAFTLLFSSQRLPLRWEETAQTGRQQLCERVRDYALSQPSLIFVTSIPQRYAPLYTGQTAAVNLIEWGNAMQGSDMLSAKLNHNGLSGITTPSLFAPNVRLLLTPSTRAMLAQYLEAAYPGASLELLTQEDGFEVWQASGA